MTPLYIAKGIIFDNKTFIFIKYNNELYIWNNGFLKITHNNITKYELKGPITLSKTIIEI
jgi:hypothetical protein